jgi:hypothetical protein
MSDYQLLTNDSTPKSKSISSVLDTAPQRYNQTCGQTRAYAQCAKMKLRAVNITPVCGHAVCGVGFDRLEAETVGSNPA